MDRGPRSGGEPTPSDGGVLSRLASGADGALQECMDRFGGLVRALARRVGIPDAEVPDAIQEVFAEIWRLAAKYDASIASETAFVAMLARRRLIDRIRRTARRTDRAPITEAIAAQAVAPESPPPPSPEEVHRATEAMGTLSPDQQRVLMLSIYRGLSHERISRSLSMPLGTVKTHARRGLMRLRELLAKEPEQEPPREPDN
jgi:RNA polymerase sigma-70 factor (ECF subfamily)